MKIDKGSFINDFIDKNLRQYSIPVYQRNYEWSAEQCEKLFEDIVQAHKLDRYHFTGSVIYQFLEPFPQTAVRSFGFKSYLICCFLDWLAKPLNYHLLQHEQSI